MTLTLARLPTVSRCALDMHRLISFSPQSKGAKGQRGGRTRRDQSEAVQGRAALTSRPVLSPLAPSAQGHSAPGLEPRPLGS